MFIRFFQIVKEVAEVLKRHDRLERDAMLKGMGLLPTDTRSHVHIARKQKEGLEIES